ncbi:MAG: hypothetical protein QGH93_10050 [Gammaproteobacteria bacterium]|jgi:hypothetical protein|nr:hypothetical protein [Chromatiales bacterium]MDP6675171.1 hypothetical protein [Gammaproteobacteria bacterium]
MAQLAIKVRGEVLSSNFDEWKLDLIAQIQSVNTELTTEAQFAQAQTNVKNFKAAEQALKKAKESAINQASDIQRLFSAIDEVSGEVRQVRLSLERQIKQRKSEIKEEIVELGIANIEKHIELQGPDFQRIDHSDYLDRGIFEEAMKYRSNINALHDAIDDTCRRIKSLIDEKVALVKNNAMKLDSLPVTHQALFQDRSELLALDASQLDELIDKRIAVLEQKIGTTNKDQDDEPTVPDEADVDLSVDTEAKETYAAIIELLATPVEAETFFRALRSAYSGNPLVRTFQLEKA